MNVLDDDTCRCSDAECPDRGDCLRWLARDDVGMWLSFSASLFPAGRRREDGCPNQIKKETE